MTPADIARARADAQGLTTPRRLAPAELVAWLGAVQSQELGLAKWSLAQRLARGSVAAVDQALARGDILRTHVLRPTWHFVPRDDLRWMQLLTAPRVLALMAYNDRRNGVTAATVVKSTGAMASAIERRGHLTRAEISQVLADAGIRVSAWLVSQLVIHAELRGVICSGVPRGAQQTYALVDERAPRSRALAGDEALAELGRRYFHSHGPATARDFRWWSGLDARSVSRAIAALGRHLESIVVDRRTYFASPKLPRAASGASVHFIQPYDEITVAYSESRDVIDPRGAARARGWSLLLRGVIARGELLGRWSTREGKGAREIDVEWLGRPAAATRAAVDRARKVFQAATSPDEGRTGSDRSRSRSTRTYPRPS